MSRAPSKVIAAAVVLALAVAVQLWPVLLVFFLIFAAGNNRRRTILAVVVFAVLAGLVVLPFLLPRLMIIENLYFEGVTTLPAKNDSPLVIYSN